MSAQQLPQEGRDERRWTWEQVGRELGKKIEAYIREETERGIDLIERYLGKDPE